MEAVRTNEIFLPRTDANGAYTEEKVIYGATVNTPELYHITCDCRLGCHCVGDGVWCFLETILSVKTPGDKWLFVAPPVLECVRDNQGSAGWNALGASDRFFIILNTPTEIRVKVLTGSRSIGLRLSCVARYYLVKKTQEPVRNWATI